MWGMKSNSNTRLWIPVCFPKANNKVVIGPTTVGGIEDGAFKIGDTAGTIDNIIQCKLYRPGSVGFGGMPNELYNIIARVTDGIYEGIAIGGDDFPGLLSDHVLRFNNIPRFFHQDPRTYLTENIDEIRDLGAKYFLELKMV